MEYDRNTRDKSKLNRSLSAPIRRAGVALASMIASFAFAGCGQDPSPIAPSRTDLSAHTAAAKTLTKTLNLQDSPGATLGKYRMFWPKRSQAEVSDRIARMAAVLRKKQVSVVSPALIGSDLARPLDDNRIEVAYDAPHDSILVRDEALAKGLEKSTIDIGEAKAESAMKEFFGGLVETGLIDRRHYDLGDIRPGHHYRQTGADDGSEPVQQWVVEYRFRVLRKLNGIEVPNNGVLIGISPSGACSTIRMGGVEIQSAHNGIEEQPIEASSLVRRKVANADISKRFEKEVSPGRQKHITWNKLMYVMPDGLSDAIVEPTMVYRFSEAVAYPDGQISLAPAKLFSFSLSDDTMAAQDLFPR